MYFKPNYAVVRHTLSTFGLGILMIAFSPFAIAADSSSYEAALKKGNQLLEQEKLSDAAAVLDEAIKSLRAEQGGDTLDTIQLLLPAAETNIELNRSKRSYNYYDAVIEILGRAASEDVSEHVIDAFASREESMYNWDHRKSPEQLTALYDIARKVLGDRDLRTAGMATKLGTAIARRNRQKDAIVYLDQAYAMLSNIKFVDPDPIGAQLLSLSVAYVLVKNMESADELLKIAAAIGASTDGPTPLRRIAPKYPDNCLFKEINGEVELTYRVDDKGRVHDVRLNEIKYWRGQDESDANYESCRENMAQAAIKAARQFRFIPDLVDGLPVASENNSTLISFHVEVTD